MQPLRINWVNIIFFAVYNGLLVVLLPLYLLHHTPSAHLLWATLIVFCICGLGVTACYHRLYAHQSYQANPVIESVLLLAGTLATVNSAFKWAHDHRLHHQYVDTDKDPYNFKQGFFWAHIGWLMTRRWQWKEPVIHSLRKNKLIMFQHYLYFILAPLSNLGCFMLVAAITKDPLGTFIFVILLRMFFLHHCTFAINSFAHYIGHQPFSRKSSAVNNWFLSLLTFGEGFHNYHHTFAYDYRNGPFWYNFDPTKWLIYMLFKLRLATHLKSVDSPQIYKHLLDERSQQIEWQIASTDSLSSNLKQEQLSKLKLLRLQAQNHIDGLKSKLTEYRNMSTPQLGYRAKRKALKKAISSLSKDFYKTLSHLNALSLT